MTLHGNEPDEAPPVATKPLIASRSPPAVMLAAVLVWASAKYGFGWDDNTVSLLTLLISGVAAYAMRYITQAPVAGLLRTPGPKLPVVTVPDFSKAPRREPYF